MMSKYVPVISATALLLALSAVPGLAQQRKSTISQRCSDGTVVTVSTGGSVGTCTTKGEVSCEGGGSSAAGSCDGGTASCSRSAGAGSCTITRAIANSGTNQGVQIRGGNHNTTTTKTGPAITTTTGLTTIKSSTLNEQHVNTLGTTQVRTQH